MADEVKVHKQVRRDRLGSHPAFIKVRHEVIDAVHRMSADTGIPLSYIYERGVKRLTAEWAAEHESGNE